jgi:uncharacterized protein
MRERRPAAPAAGPVRTCVGCRRTRPRAELVRLAATPTGVRLDRRRRAPGRGANLCPDLACIEAANRRGAAPLRRALRGAPLREVREALDALRTEVVQGRDEPKTRPSGRLVPEDGTVRSHRT